MLSKMNKKLSNSLNNVSSILWRCSALDPNVWSQTTHNLYCTSAWSIQYIYTLIVIYLLTTNGLVHSQPILDQITSIPDTDFWFPCGVWGDIHGGLYVSDSGNNLVEYVSPTTGLVSVFVGTGDYDVTYGDGGAPTSASISSPIQFYGNNDSISPSTFVVVDGGGKRIRLINNITNIITTVVGNGETGSTGNGGPATSASLHSPVGVFSDNQLNLYIAECEGRQIRKVEATTSEITTIAGGTASNVYSGDGGQSSSASLDCPSQLFIDNELSMLYVAVYSHHNIRAIDLSSGIINLFAGNQASSELYGAATSVQIRGPKGVWKDRFSNVFLCEGDMGRIKRIDHTGQTTVIAGFGVVSYSGDDDVVTFIGDEGPPTAAAFNNPYMIYADLSGFVYVADQTNLVVRKIFGYAPTASPSVYPTNPTQLPTIAPTVSPSIAPSMHPVASPTGQPSRIPSIQPSSHPSRQPSTKPTSQPSRDPSLQPSARPTEQPTTQPTGCPSSQPSRQPSSQPSSQPSVRPSCQPSRQPTAQPSIQPSGQPSIRPSSQPSKQPSSKPSTQPSSKPSCQPSSLPSTQPSAQPISNPSCQPSTQPSSKPSTQPSSKPSCQPSDQPSTQPSAQPVKSPSSQPTSCPSRQPSSIPSTQPSGRPTTQPSRQPSTMPSAQPSAKPSQQPSSQPSSRPTLQPTAQPTGLPSSQPSAQPSCNPSSQPSAHPSVQPSSRPSTQPSTQPSGSPSGQPISSPTSQPSGSPSNQPTGCPTVHPSEIPSLQPYALPTSQPSFCPTHAPSSQPQGKPSGQPSSKPSAQPSSQPVCLPSGQPSSQPSRQPQTHPTSQSSGQPSRQPVSVPAAVQGATQQPSVVPTRASSSFASDVPSLAPSVAPTRSLPLHTVVSVLYPVNETFQFKIIIPFLFTNEPANTDLLVDITFSNASKVGTNYLYLGGAVGQRDVKTESLYSISPAISYDFKGRSVSNAGDVNGDGFDDLIIGVPYASRCYVMFGNMHGFVNMTEGFTILGTVGTLTGWSVSKAGDVNNDTIADILIGAPYAGSQSAGAAFVIYGKRTVFNQIDLSNLNPADGYVIYGVAVNDATGYAGDVNGDGFDDIIVGALRVNFAFSGSAFIVYGSKVKRQTPLQLTLISSTAYSVFTGASYSWFGYSVSGAGDVNRDTFGDVIIGSVPRKTVLGTSISYLIYGNKTVAVNDVSKMTASQGVVITGGGVVVNGVGDINRDGFDDAMIGGGDYGVDRGAGYVVTLPRNLTSFVSAAPIPVPSQIPSLQPTALPSVRPTKTPSEIPTRHPTQPTVRPTIAPSGPTLPPTVQPTQPTSRPTRQPVRPSLTPTRMSSEPPSACPSIHPTELPSVSPTIAPTMRPSTQTPTWTPSAEKTSGPTRLSVVRPTTAPTTFNSNITYTDREYTSGGVYEVKTTSINHIVNTSSDVTFTLLVSARDSMFTFIPHPESVVVIHNFTFTTDVLNLQYFPLLTRMSDVNTTVFYTSGASDTVSSSSRHLRDAVASGTRITLSGNQRVYLSNVSMSDMRNTNFHFATSGDASESLLTVIKKTTQASFTVKMVGAGLAGLLGAYLLYKMYTLYQEESYMRRIKKIPINFEEIKLHNTTFISFNNGDSDQSITTNSTNSEGSTESNAADCSASSDSDSIVETEPSPCASLHTAASSESDSKQKQQDDVQDCEIEEADDEDDSLDLSVFDIDFDLHQESFDSAMSAEFENFEVGSVMSDFEDD